MKVRVGRAIGVAVVAELVGVGILAVLVTIFGPSGFREAQSFAMKLGMWVGPISGFLLCLIGGWWVARAAPCECRVLNGVTTGAVGALLDISIAMGFDSSVSPLLWVSNSGRVVGGAIGGWAATHRS